MWTKWWATKWWPTACSSCGARLAAKVSTMGGISAAIIAGLGMLMLPVAGKWGMPALAVGVVAWLVIPITLAGACSRLTVVKSRKE